MRLYLREELEARSTWSSRDLLTSASTAHESELPLPPLEPVMTASMAVSLGAFMLNPTALLTEGGAGMKPCTPSASANANTQALMSCMSCCTGVKKH
jgi:hypothetical protein